MQRAQGPIIEGNTISTGDDGNIVKSVGVHEVGHQPDFKTFMPAPGLINSNAQGMQDDGGVAPAKVTICDHSMADCFLQTPGALSCIQGILSMATILRDAGRASNFADFRGNRQIMAVNSRVQVVGDHWLQGNTVVVDNANNVTLTKASATLQVSP